MVLLETGLFRVGLWRALTSAAEEFEEKMILADALGGRRRALESAGTLYARIRAAASKGDDIVQTTAKAWLVEFVSSLKLAREDIGVDLASGGDVLPDFFGLLQEE